MTCPHFMPPDQCTVVSGLTRVAVISVLTPAACAQCGRTTPPQCVNEVTVSLACGQLREMPLQREALVAAHGHLLRRGFPPFAQQAWSAAKAVADWVSAGAYGVSPATYAARLRTCDSCPNRDLHRCRICGCWIRGKASLPTETCPIGLWSAEEPAR